MANKNGGRAGLAAMKHVLLLMMILVAVPASAAPKGEEREMLVQSMHMDPMDLTAATYSRDDLNGVPCAIVKVRMPEGAEFEGSIIKPVEYKTGEYWVYMPQNTKALRVKHSSATPLHVYFESNGVAPLQSKATYVLDIAMPEVLYVTDERQKVEIRFSPSTAVVLVDDQLADIEGNTATATLTAGREYRYTVSARGYVGKSGTFFLNPAVPASLEVNLAVDTMALGQGASRIKAEADQEYAKRNYARAMELYRQIPGNVTAQFNMGYMYRYGKGVSQDFVEAVNWYRKAAEQGHVRAQSNLGYMYETGKGVSKNYTEAAYWYRKAAEQGFAIAQYNLGLAYYYGDGVTQDIQEAYRWIQKAADQNDENAIKFLDENPL